MTDAWKQLDDLMKKYTDITVVRNDIKVYTDATKRSVELVIKGQFTGPRNVDTMLELAEAITKACEFVKESNPDWAERMPLEWEHDADD